MSAFSWVFQIQKNYMFKSKKNVENDCLNALIKDNLVPETMQLII